MKIIIHLIVFLFSCELIAQASYGPYGEQLESEVKSFEKLLKKERGKLEREMRNIALAEQEIKQLVEDSTLFDEHRTERQKKISNLLDLLETERRKTPWIKRTLGKKGKIYNCYRAKIKSGHRPNACGELDLPDHVQEKISLYNRYWLYDDIGAKTVKTNKSLRLQNEILRKDRAKDQVVKKERRILTIRNEMEGKKKRLKDYVKVKVAGPEELGCSPDTPTIDLEKDGILKNLPYDHQNGLGTCFANVGKNLLYAATGGEVNASFLDMALQYHSYKGEKPTDIDGGTPCGAIKATQDSGFCARSDSPLENGDKMPINGIFGGISALDEHAETLRKFESFLKAKEVLEETITPSRINNAIKKLLEDPEIELPWPKLGFEVLDKGPLFSFYADQYPKSKKTETSHAELTEDMRQFEQKVIDLLGEVSSESLENRFNKASRNLFKKWDVPLNVQQRAIKEIAKKKLFEIDRNKFNKKLQKSMGFFKALTGGDTKVQKENFTIDCLKGNGDLMKLGVSMGDLLDHLKKLDVPLQRLIDKKGLRPNKELLQLAVAPNCLNESNRPPVSKSLMCEGLGTLVEAKKLDMKKENFIFYKTLANLKKGLPVGNSFKTHFGAHINTIVGVRYNKSIGQCEFKIRESMTASSEWESASEISSKMYNLTEVTRP